MYFGRKYRTGVQFRVTSLEISILMIGGKWNTMKIQWKLFASFHFVSLGQTQIYHIKICYDIFLTVTLIFRVVFSLKALGECQFLCFYPVWSVLELLECVTHRKSSDR